MTEGVVASFVYVWVNGEHDERAREGRDYHYRYMTNWFDYCAR